MTLTTHHHCNLFNTTNMPDDARRGAIMNIRACHPPSGAARSGAEREVEEERVGGDGDWRGACKRCGRLRPLASAAMEGGMDGVAIRSRPPPPIPVTAHPLPAPEVSGADTYLSAGSESSAQEPRVDVDPGAHEEEGVEAIEQAAVARDEVTGVFHAGRALEHGLDQVADGAEDRSRHGDQQAIRHGERRE